MEDYIERFEVVGEVYDDYRDYWTDPNNWDNLDSKEDNDAPKCGNCEADDCENCRVGVWVREHKGLQGNEI